MEKVRIHFNNTSPRIYFDITISVNTIPVVGDVIFVHKEHFVCISKTRLEQIHRGLKFKVVERMLIPSDIHNSLELHWNLKVEFYNDLIFTYEERAEKRKMDKKFSKTS